MSCCGNESVNTADPHAQASRPKKQVLSSEVDFTQKEIKEAEYDPSLLTEIDGSFFKFNDLQKKNIKDNVKHSVPLLTVEPGNKNRVAIDDTANYRFFGQVNGSGKIDGKAQFQDNQSKNFYLGAFRNDQMEGEGAEYLANGDVFFGTYLNDSKKNGDLYYYNGNVYKGDFNSQDQPHGYGTYTFSDGRSYQGQFVKGLREGQGVYKWPNGTVYDGEFKAGKQHGIAKFTQPNGGPTKKFRFVNGEATEELK